MQSLQTIKINQVENPRINQVGNLRIKVEKRSSRAVDHHAVHHYPLLSNDAGRQKRGEGISHKSHSSQQRDW